MSDIELLIGLLGVVAAIVWLAGRLGVPYPIFLLLAGLGIGYVPGIPAVEIEPEVIFLVFLPPLIHAAAWQTSPRHLRANARTIGILAIGLVGATMAGVAVVAHALVDGLSWPAAFVLGAVVAPTDTVAAVAVFRRIGVPERIVYLVEGESLINDGTSLVLYRTALTALAAGTFAVGDAALDLLVVGTGGAAFGLLLALLIRRIRLRIEDSLIEVTVTLLTPFLAYALAEEVLHVSGILAVVASGLYLGYKSTEDFTPTTRLQAYGFWAQLTFVLESLLFILIGLQFPAAVEELEGETGALVLAALAVAAVVVGIRVLTALAVVRLPLRERAVVGWAGMRGAVSLAAALAVPAQADGRAAILFLTLTTISITLVLQGLTLPLLIRRLGVEEEPPGEREKSLARFRTTEAALTRIADLGFDDEDGFSAATVERAREMYTERVRQLTGDCREGVPARSGADQVSWAKLRGTLLATERAALTDLRNDGRISLAVLREVERDLDLEEERLARTSVPRPERREPEPVA